MTKSVAERFWSKVLKSDGCWEWQASKHKFGYGSFWIDGASRGAHCVSYELSVGPLPDGMWVLHKCDNPMCVNPAHLFLGTQRDNMRDKSAKRRNGNCVAHRLYRGDEHWSRREPHRLVRGERHGNAKLSDAQVANIRMLRTLGANSTQCGEWFGVNSATVRKRTRTVAT